MFLHEQAKHVYRSLYSKKLLVYGAFVYEQNSVMSEIRKPTQRNSYFFRLYYLYWLDKVAHDPRAEDTHGYRAVFLACIYILKNSNNNRVVLYSEWNNLPNYKLLMFLPLPNVRKSAGLEKPLKLGPFIQTADSIVFL